MESTHHIYPNVLRAVTDTPWAIRREVLETILQVVNVRLAGERFTRAEIEARVGAAPPSRPQTSVGAIALIPIWGVITAKAGMMSDMSGGTSLRTFLGQFRQAMATDRVQGILLDVDSPGGSVDLLPEVAAEIRDARERKPITAIANVDAASAAYWLAAQASELVVTPSGQVGSIGVFATHKDYSAADEMEGVKITIIKAGKYKAELADSEPLSEGAAAHMQEVVDAYYEMFLSDVAKGRRLSVDVVDATFGQGRMVMAADALKARMVDSIETFDQVVARLTGGASVASTEASTESSAPAAEDLAEDLDDPVTEPALDLAARRRSSHLAAIK